MLNWKHLNSFLNFNNKKVLKTVLFYFILIWLGFWITKESMIVKKGVYKHFFIRKKSNGLKKKQKEYDFYFFPQTNSKCQLKTNKGIICWLNI